MNPPAPVRKHDPWPQMVARATTSTVATTAVRLSMAVVERMCPRSSAYGIRLVAFDDPSRGQGELFFARVTLALGLIERYDPRWIRRMRRDFSGIWLGGAPGPCFEVMTRRCVLSWNSVMNGGIINLALTLIHEATHARIASRGAWRYRSVPEARHEEAAVRQETAFAARLPATDDLRRALAVKLDDPWWTPEKMLERQRAWSRDVELPGWIARWAERRYERRMREAPE